MRRLTTWVALRESLSSSVRGWSSHRNVLEVAFLLLRLALTQGWGRLGGT